jgi:hypothetical protein
LAVKAIGGGMYVLPLFVGLKLAYKCSTIDVALAALCQPGKAQLT